jgi:hypothetical protein
MIANLGQARDWRRPPQGDGDRLERFNMKSSRFSRSDKKRSGFPYRCKATCKTHDLALVYSDDDLAVANNYLTRWIVQVLTLNPSASMMSRAEREPLHET